MNEEQLSDAYYEWILEVHSPISKERAFELWEGAYDYDKFLEDANPEEFQEK